MEYQNQAAPPRKRGCLKLACGGCLCVFLLSIALGVAGWFSLNRWEPGKSAWELLPPSTTWAVEGHDLHLLLDSAFKDQGVLSLLDRAGEALDKAMAEMGDTNERPSGDVFRLVAEMYGSLGFLHKALAPNIAAAGMGGEGGREFFALVRPSTWMRWTSEVDDSSIRQVDEGKIKLYAAMVDGWMALSVSEALLEEILDQRTAPAKPFGPAPGRTDAYLAFGFRNSTESSPVTPPASTSTRPAAGSLMLNDPFAVAESSDEPPSSAGGFKVRGMLLPVDGGWSVDGDSAWDGMDFGEAGRGGGPAVRSDSLPVEHDLSLRVFLPEHRWKQYQNAIEARAEPGMADDKPSWQRMGWLWLWTAWLANASGDFVVHADKPAVPEKDGVPPLPVITLGWTNAPGVDSPKAAAAFNDTAKLFLESLTGPGGAPVPDTLRKKITYDATQTAQGFEGRVSLPPVLANSAQPAWLLASNAGWLSTDPKGIPAQPDQAAATLDSAGVDAGALVVNARWDISESLRYSTRTLFLDRLDQMPDSIIPDREAERHVVDIINHLVAVFPAGTLDIDAPPNTPHATFHLWLRQGVRNDFP